MAIEKRSAVKRRRRRARSVPSVVWGNIYFLPHARTGSGISAIPPSRNRRRRPASARDITDRRRAEKAPFGQNGGLEEEAKRILDGLGLRDD